MVVKLTDENFEEEVLKADETVLVDMYADWCGPCKVMSPLIDELSEEKLPNVKVCKLNVDEAEQIATEYGVTSIPLFLIFKRGQIVKNFLGVTDIDVIKENLLK